MLRFSGFGLVPAELDVPWLVRAPGTSPGRLDARRGACGDPTSRGRATAHGVPALWWGCGCLSVAAYASRMSTSRSCISLNRRAAQDPAGPHDRAVIRLVHLPVLALVARALGGGRRAEGVGVDRLQRQVPHDVEDLAGLHVLALDLRQSLLGVAAANGHWKSENSTSTRRLPAPPLAYALAALGSIESGATGEPPAWRVPRSSVLISCRSRWAAPILALSDSISCRCAFRSSPL